MFDSGVVEIASVAPGSEAALWLSQINSDDLDLRSVANALAVVQQHLAWVASVEARLMARAQTAADAAVLADPGDREWVSEEVGAVLRLRGDYAAARMATAATLVRRLPDTLALLTAGAISAVQARMLAEQVADRALDDEACARVQARVLPRAPDQSSTQFRKSLHRAVLACAPRSAEQAHQVEAATRRVVIRPAEDGMGWLMAYLPVPELMTLKSAIWRLAQANKNQADRANATAAANAAAAATRAAAETAGAAPTAAAAGAAGDVEGAAATENAAVEGAAAADGADGADGAGGGGDDWVERVGFVPIDAYRADALIEIAEPVNFSV